jgi:hypothetical protein
MRLQSSVFQYTGILQGKNPEWKHANSGVESEAETGERNGTRSNLLEFQDLTYVHLASSSVDLLISRLNLH